MLQSPHIVFKTEMGAEHTVVHVVTVEQTRRGKGASSPASNTLKHRSAILVLFQCRNRDWDWVVLHHRCFGEQRHP